MANTKERTRYPVNLTLEGDLRDDRRAWCAAHDVPSLSDLVNYLLNLHAAHNPLTKERPAPSVARYGKRLPQSKLAA